MKYISIVITLISFGCADTYYRQGISSDSSGATHAVATKAFQKYSRTVGPGRVVVTSDSVTHEWFDPSPNVPRRVVTTTDPKTGIVRTDEMPIVASSDPSISTIATGNAINRAMHGLSNIIGTVFTGWAGLEAARGLTEVAVTQSNNAANVAVQNSKSATAATKIGAKADIATKAIDAGVFKAAPIVP